MRGGGWLSAEHFLEWESRTHSRYSDLTLPAKFIAYSNAQHIGGSSGKADMHPGVIF